MLTVEELETLMTKPDLSKPLGLRDRALLEVMCSTAIRRNEAKNLLPQHIDRQQRFLYVKQGKGSRDRVVPISKRAINWVERYENDERPQLLSHGGGSGFLFVTRNGCPWHVSNLRQRVGKYIDLHYPNLYQSLPAAFAQNL